MLTIAPKSTSGPTRKMPAEKPVRILHVPLNGQSVELYGAATEIGLQNPGNPTDLPMPNDIIVYDGKPWHFAGGALHPHPLVHLTHPETVLQLSLKRQESAVWWSDEMFTITKILPVQHHGDADLATAPSGQPYFPFSGPLETVQEEDVQRKKIFVVRSTVPVGEADNRTFKITFTMHDEAIDPDMHCGD